MLYYYKDYERLADDFRDGGGFSLSWANRDRVPSGIATRKKFTVVEVGLKD